MSHPRLNVPLVLALVLLPLLSRGAEAQVLLTSDQPSYEVTQLLTVKVQAPPGSPTFMLVDVLPGPKSFPVGTFEIGFSPVFFVATLGPMPASGEMKVHEAFSCRTTYLYGTEIYLQAVCVINGVKTLSNGLHIAEMMGDCTDECTSGIVEMGLQVTLPDVPNSGILWVNSWKSGEQSQSYGPALEVAIEDLASVATGILPAPLTNSNGSIVVSMLELNGSDLTVRFFVNATLAGHPSLEDSTLMTIHFDAVSARGDIQSDCSVPLKVGDVAGAFTVIKIIDGG